METCKEAPELNQWGSYKASRYNKKDGVPIELLVLSVLHYLGRGWTIDCLHENTIINPETICTFIHAFLQYSSTILFDKYVSQPATLDELQDCNFEFKRAGCLDVLGQQMQPTLSWRNVLTVLHNQITLFIS